MKLPIKSIKYNLGDPEDYNPITLARKPVPDLRSEYSRLRRIAQKRLSRIEQSPDFADSAIVENNRGWLSVPPSEVPQSELPSLLSNVTSLLESKTGSLSGLRRARERTITSLRDAGIKGINTKNFGDFTKFMDRTRIFREAYIPYPKRARGSEARDAARQIRPRIFALMEKGNISEAAIMKEFQFFRDNLDRLEKLVRSGSLNPDRKRAYSANELRKMLGMEPSAPRSIKEARSEARDLIPSKKRRR